MKTSKYKSSTRFGPWLAGRASWPNSFLLWAVSLSGKSEVRAIRSHFKTGNALIAL
jgi:hypothetical protein